MAYERVKRNREFSYVFRKGQRYATGRLQIHVLCKRREGRRIGVTCTRNAPNAVARNHAKRLLREAFRAIDHEYGLCGNWDLIMVLRYRQPVPTFAELCADLYKLMRRAGVLCEPVGAADGKTSDGRDGAATCSKTS